VLWFTNEAGIGRLTWADISMRLSRLSIGFELIEYL